MPSTRATSSAKRASHRRSGDRILRLLAWSGVASVVAFAVVLLAIRFIVFPQVESQRERIAAMLSEQLGQPVEIGAIATGWDGWNPKLILTNFRVRARLEASETPLVELPEVDVTLAWTSLPLMQLRLKQLVIERPRLAIRRDRSGLLHVAGLEFDPAQQTDDSTLTDWLLKQRRIIVRDALITWNDDLRNAPQLVLDRVQFRLENEAFGRHRIGLTGTPPPELAAPIDIRVEVAGAPLREWQRTEGRAYVRLDYADVGAWRDWLPLPVPVDRGKGALRLWFDFGGGRITGLTADVELADVRTRLAEGLPELEMPHLSGRMGWKDAGGERELAFRHLAFTTASGVAQPPVDFALRLSLPGGDRTAGGEISFDRVELEPLRTLAAQLPLPERTRIDLARLAPQGALTRTRLRWDGGWDAPSAFSLTSGFERLGIAPQGDVPGVRGASGSVEATQAGGTLRLASRDLAIDSPPNFTEPLALDTLDADVRWTRGAARTEVQVETLAFASPQATGSARGTWRSLPQGPGEIDLTAAIPRADVRLLHRYLPRWLQASTRDWVRLGLLQGTGEDARMILKGDLAQFPFAGGKNGQFLVTVKARGVDLNYADGWPHLQRVDADVRFEGPGLHIELQRGEVLGAQVGPTRGDIPDLNPAHPQLTIVGEARGPTAEFLRFIARSPVAGWIDHFTDGIEAQGQGLLGLRLDLPLGRDEGQRVAGEFSLVNNQLQLVGVPALRQVNGKFVFTEQDLRGRDITAEILGGPVRVALSSAEGRVRVTADGTANLAQVGREWPSEFSARVAGSADWTFTADVRPRFSAWTIESLLRGAAFDLPAPLAKSAAESVPLKIERRAVANTVNEDALTIAYGSKLAAAVHRRLDERGDARIDRMHVLVGAPVERGEQPGAERPGVWVKAEVPALNVDDWLSLAREAGAGTAVGPAAANAALPAVQGIDIDAVHFEAIGRRLNDTRLAARRTGDDWRFDIRGREITGTGVWSAATAAAPNGRLVARLERLSVPAAGDLVPWRGVAEARGERKAEAGNPWPTLDVEAAAFVARGRDLGRLELVAQPQGHDWQIERMTLANDGGRLDAEGNWRAVGAQQQTKLDVTLDVTDAGTFLGRLGHPGQIVGAPTRMTGQLAWAGAPSEFDYPSLNGTFRVQTGAGRFTKVDPGAGRLLGVLSLQALPRRITLDFRDVFSEGFAFDDINGTVRIRNGVLSTDNFRLVGPAAQVSIAGDADLARETQRLTVRVQPTLSAGVSAGAALLFFANPLVGVAVGAGSLLAQKVLKDPIEQMFTYEYLVTGSWSDPIVSRGGLASTASAPAPVAPATR
jgi:uncharacterized protein (TIGR02099 family)